MNNIENPLNKDEIKQLLQKIMLIEKMSALDASSKQKTIVAQMKKEVEKAVK